MSCEHWTQETGFAKASLYAACPWCEIARLKQENDRLQDEDRIWEKHGLVQIVWERDQLRALLTHAPIAKVTVRESFGGDVLDWVMCAPSLPPGEHDLYLMPSVPQEAPQPE